MTVTILWWHIPILITIITYGFVLYMEIDRRCRSSGGILDIGAVVLVFFFSLATSINLFAWLVAALLR